MPPYFVSVLLPLAWVPWCYTYWRIVLSDGVHVVADGVFPGVGSGPPGFSHFPSPADPAPLHSTAGGGKNVWIYLARPRFRKFAKGKILPWHWRIFVDPVQGAKVSPQF